MKKGAVKSGATIILGSLSLFTILGILFAGLWPLDFHPVNEVGWLPSEQGIRFSGRGIAYSPVPLNGLSPSKSVPDAFSIEMWLQPAGQPDRFIAHILSLYDAGGKEYYSLGQWKSDLEITVNRIANPVRTDHRKRINLGKVLPAGSERFVAITSGSRGTAVYIDGEPAKFYPGINLFEGRGKTSLQLILGTSPSGEYCWRGKIFGVAIYNRSLEKEEVARHYRLWLEEGGIRGEGDDASALYLFNEGSKTVIHDRTKKGNDLLMPLTFRVLLMRILVLPWDTVSVNRRDIFVNILGFVPFGFIFSRFLSGIRKQAKGSNYLIVIFLGGGMSLAIELIQAFLPTRTSDLTDLTCNILGTIMGIGLCHLLLRLYPLKGRSHSTDL